MALYEVDDLDERMNLMTAKGVRRVWEGGTPDIQGRHLHPRDTGGTLVSLDQPTVPGEWAWGGPTWRTRRTSSVASSIRSFTVTVPNTKAAASKWNELGINCAVEFNEDPLHPEGLSGVTLDCVDPSRDGETMTLVGITFALKAAQS
jgi:hypothetical protein